MENKVIILHGCADPEEMDPAHRFYDKHWIPWVKRQLEARGFVVEAPLMPNPWAPNYEAYKAEFEKTTISENDILVGHSCAAAFLTRWLGETQQKVRKTIFVAPWKIADGTNEARVAFYGHPIDPSVRALVGELVIFTSNNEQEDGKKSAAIFHEALGGRVIELSNHGHYIIGDMGTEEFPELIEEITRN